MRFPILVALCGSALATLPNQPVAAQAAIAPADKLQLFGNRAAVLFASLSPDGKEVAFVMAEGDRETAILVQATEPNAPTRRIAVFDGQPERARKCGWVSTKRLLCQIVGRVGGGQIAASFTRSFAVDSDGSNAKLIGNSGSSTLQGGDVLDWLPAEQDKVLFETNGVDRVDTRSGKRMPAISPQPRTFGYMTDGEGEIRLRYVWQGQGDDQILPVADVYYTLSQDKSWKRLQQYNWFTREGFIPVTVSKSENAVYGTELLNGRKAVSRYMLDGSLAQEFVYAPKDFSIDSIITIGPHRRAVGASYTSDGSHRYYFDPEIAKLDAMLQKALPGFQEIWIADATRDEQVLLVLATSDNRPGIWYVLDRKSRRLQPLAEQRPNLAGVPLPAARRVDIPLSTGKSDWGMLTVPAGSLKKPVPLLLWIDTTERNSPWGFDPEVQYFVSKGFAVLKIAFQQPDGYGELWFNQKGFAAWREAVEIATSAANMLVAQGVADPANIAILGRGHGGYVALQTAALHPELIGKVIAIDPITDLKRLRSSVAGSPFRSIQRTAIGATTLESDASPVNNADRLKAPLLLVQSGLDEENISEQIRLMEASLKKAGKPYQVLRWVKLDDYLNDNQARRELLRTGADFLQTPAQ
ncbi:alpha/beta hydrolase family protein [Sandaracinobacter neustonicus]|uniref:alpha/beta hydrolase family protein n=1 Tax=Sandaracinobacter neustonicus TaxID=1715348 RepID=UPI0015E3B95B|nr:prolyl oligopeptidase family serine peptidase [Sandaracinobacter neustonicus]